MQLLKGQDYSHREQTFWIKMGLYFWEIPLPKPHLTQIRWKYPHWVDSFCELSKYVTPWGIFYQHGLTLIPAWISNHIWWRHHDSKNLRLHYCWCLGSSRPQIISSHGVGCINYKGPLMRKDFSYPHHFSDGLYWWIVQFCVVFKTVQHTQIWKYSTSIPVDKST